MTDQSATPETGALTVDQAIAALTPEPTEQAKPEAAPTEAAAEGEENTEGEASSPEEAEDGAETPAEEAEAEAEPEAVAPVDPPKYWSQDAKEAFAKLPADLQAVVLQQEGPREEAASKAKAEAAEKARAADEQTAKIGQFAEALADRLPQWMQTFQSRWGNTPPDWVAYAHEHGVDAMTLAKTQFEQESSQLAHAVQTQQAAHAEAKQAQVRAEFAKLAEIAPDLVDPQKGDQKRTEITKYLIDQGIPVEAVRDISATEMVLARKAMLYDLAQSQLKAAPKPKPAALGAKAAPVRPAAAQAGSPAQRSAQQVANRFAQTRSVDDAVALLMTRKA